MLNKPKFMSPSINMYGNSVIDLNSNNLPFSCVVDGNEVVTDFQIVISRLSDNTLVFDTGMRSLDKPFFPINNRNQNVVFSINLKDYFDDDSVNNGFENSTDAYYWAITFKNSDSGTETCSATEVFYANDIPCVEIQYNSSGNEGDYETLSDEAVITSKQCEFRANYTQEQNVPIKKYGWRLTDAISGFVIMDTISQNQIYGIASDISCLCNGLINKTKYLLEVYIETQNGHFDIMKSLTFYVDYPVAIIDADFEVVPVNDTAGIMLNWGNLRTTEGVVVGDKVNYIEDFPVQSSASISIPKDTRVVFEGTSSDKDLSINEDSYVVLSFQINKNESMTLFEMDGEDDLSNIEARRLETVVSNGVAKLRYTVRKGEIVAYKEQELSSIAGEMSWCVVTLPPMVNEAVDFKLVDSTSVGGILPSEDLYPVDLYTYDTSGKEVEGVYNKATEDYSPDLTYFKLVDGELVEYVYSVETWDSDYASLYCCLYPSYGQWNALRS